MYPFCRQVHYPTLNLGVGGVVAVFADLTLIIRPDWSLAWDGARAA
jgi:hypothetical protein